MAYEKCNDCHGSGEIEIESIHFFRERYDHSLKRVVTPYIGKNDWHLAQCHCVGEENYFKELECQNIS